MKSCKKRGRSESAGAALVEQSESLDAALSTSPFLKPKQNDCLSSYSWRATRRHADDEYIALEERSTALLVKLRQRHRCIAGSTVSVTAEASAEEAEPLTVPCTLESFNPCAAHHTQGTTAQGPSSLAFNYRLLAETASLQRREASSQTENHLSVTTQKTQLSSELCELFTLLHVFFA